MHYYESEECNFFCGSVVCYFCVCVCVCIIFVVDASVFYVIRHRHMVHFRDAIFVSSCKCAYITSVWKLIIIPCLECVS